MTSRRSFLSALALVVAAPKNLFKRAVSLYPWRNVSTTVTIDLNPCTRGELALVRLLESKIAQEAESFKRCLTKEWLMRNEERILLGDPTDDQ